MLNATTTRQSNAARASERSRRLTALVIESLTDQQPTRLQDIRRSVSTGLGVERVSESQFSKAIRGLLASGEIVRAKRGYYQLATQPQSTTQTQSTSSELAIPNQASVPAVIERTAQVPSQRDLKSVPSESLEAESHVQAEPQSASELESEPEPAGMPQLELEPELEPELESKPERVPPVEPRQSFTELPIHSGTEEDERAAARVSENHGDSQPVIERTPVTGWDAQKGFFARAAFPMAWFVITGVALILFDVQVGLTVAVGAAVVLTVSYLVLAREPRSATRNRSASSQKGPGGTRHSRRGAGQITGLMSTQHR